MTLKSWKHLLDDEVDEPLKDIEEDSPKEIEKLLAEDSKISKLLLERKNLEEKMSFLTQANGENDQKSDPRFPIQTLAQRRNEDARWLAQRKSVISKAGKQSSLRKLTQTGTASKLRSGQTALQERSSLKDFDIEKPLQSLKEKTNLASDKKLKQHKDKLLTKLHEKMSNVGNELIDDTLKNGFSKDRIRKKVKEEGMDIVRKVAKAKESYESRRDKMLSVINGGSGDLDARAKRISERLEKMAETGVESGMKDRDASRDKNRDENRLNSIKK
tara:strand:- start:11791 stop:12609 length:819 start_codon:yes stop_codon:yes gene_type:complete